MRQRRRITLALAVTVGASAALVLAMPTLLGMLSPQAAGMASLAAATVIVIMGKMVMGTIERGIFRPLAELGRDLQSLAGSRRGDQPLSMPALDHLEPLARPLKELIARLGGNRQEAEDRLRQATQRITEQKSWLEVILLDLSEGVVVCNMTHHILLYNQAAIRLIGRPETVGLGRPLFSLIARQPILHALELIALRDKTGEGGAGEQSVPFVCATADARLMLQGQMAPILGADRIQTGYVVTFADVSREMASLARDGAIGRALSRDLRAPLANMRAAAETLAAYPSMSPGERAAFDRVMIEESALLSSRIEALDAEFRSQSGARWLMDDISSIDLFNCLARSLVQSAGIRLIMTGPPLWLHGDSHSLHLAILALTRRLKEHTGQSGFDIEARPGDRHVYIDLAWKGPPVPSSAIDSWLGEPQDGVPGNLDLGDILERHGSEPWSQTIDGKTAALRIPLPPPTRAHFAEAEPPPPPRPEFYDFDLISAHSDTGRLGASRLSELAYVVFDTETTGLKPTEGDRIIQIGAVRVVNRRILSGETFERLINPGRPIPPASIRFHGITDDLVVNKPPIEVVLPQFAEFAGNAVLVAHNAAFDLKFLQIMEAETGISFANPVLDTLLIAALVDPEGDHSLDNVARRLGIETHRRHSALADALVAADVLVRLFDLLEAKGITTFDEAMRATNMTAQIRTRGMKF